MTINVEWGPVIKAAAIASFVKLGYIIVAFTVLSSLGESPDTVLGWYQLLQIDRLKGILLLDAPMVILLVMYYFTSYGIYAVYKDKYRPVMTILTAFIFLSVTLALATNEVLTLVHLSDRYLHATSDALRFQLLAAGEAVMAMSLWHTTAGFFVGILMQGSFLIISLLMLEGSIFSRRTAYTGILCNGLDLLQHVLKLFVPRISFYILIIAGVFYLLWYPLLGLDFIKINKK